MDVLRILGAALILLGASIGFLPGLPPSDMLLE